MPGTGLVTTGSRALIAFATIGTHETIVDAHLVKDAVEEIGVATAQVDAELAATTTSFKKLGIEGKLMSAGMMIGGKAMKYTGEAILAAGVGAVITGVKFQQAMANVNSVARTNATGLKQLQGLAIDASTQTAFSATESAKAEMLLARAGLNQKNVMLGLIPTLNLAAASQTDVTDTATLMAEVMNAFDLHGSKAVNVSNQLAYAVQGGAMSLDDLNQSMKYVGAAAYATHQPLSGVIGLLKAMALHGVKGSLAGTTLRFSMTRLIKPVKQVTDGLNLLNLRTDQIKNSKGLLPMATILARVYKHSQALDANTRNAAIEDIFGVRAYTGISAIFNQGPAAVAKFIKQAQAGSASAKKMADDINNTIEKQLLRFYHLLDDIGIIIFMKFSPRLTGALKGVNSALSNVVKAMPELLHMIETGQWRGAVYWIDSMVNAHGYLAKVVFALVRDYQNLKIILMKEVVPALRAVFGPVVKAGIGGLYLLFKLLGGVMKILAHHVGLVTFVLKVLLSVFVAWRAAVLLMNIVMAVFDALTSPWLLIVAAVILLAVAFYEVYKNWDSIVKYMKMGLNWLKDQLMRFVMFILAPWIALWGWVMKHWQLLLKILIGPFLGWEIFLFEHFGTIKGWFLDFISDLAKWAVIVEKWLFKMFRAAITWLVGKLQWILDAWHKLEGLVNGGGHGPAPGASGRGGATGASNFVNHRFLGVPGTAEYERNTQPKDSNLPLKVLNPLTSPNEILDPGHLRQTNLTILLDHKVLAKAVAKHGQDTVARMKGTNG